MRTSERSSRRRNILVFFLRWSWLSVIVFPLGCRQPLNSPYPAEEAKANIYYTTFSEQPKHLDPAVAYSSDEYRIIALVYEPPLQYRYDAERYLLEPLTATSLPKVTYLDREGKPLPPGTPPEEVAFTEYEIEIRRGIRYQPHPAFVRNRKGELRYCRLREADVEPIETPYDFPELGTRELVAEDYVYQIKRLVHPQIHSPIASLMAHYIVGLRELGEQLQRDYEAWRRLGGDGFFDIRNYPLEGAYAVDRYRYRIRIRGVYPQFRYWLAMPFFAPMPPEADLFYGQELLQKKNITLDWYPVGTGPFMVVENNPNRRILLQRNPNHLELDPQSGQPLPHLDGIQFLLEREAIPAWNKFLQGYYETSGIASDLFDRAITFGAEGRPTLTKALREKGIRLVTTTAPSVFYLAFNMVDPVVGGLEESHRKLRQAIAIALDFEEYIAIFLNGQGVVAHSPIPPGIPGHERDYNPYTHTVEGDRIVRRSLEEAKKLLAEAGYPNGIDPKSGKPLVLYYDAVGGGADDKARFDWYRKQFRKLGIELIVRATDYNRFREKVRSGNAQIFSWGWNADYPDPENFLFLFYCPNSKVRSGGENAANYCNPEFDRLFEKMRRLEPGPERRALIRRMVQILRRDTPWVFGFYPKSFLLYHQWLSNVRLNPMANNRLKYFKLDPELRAEKRQIWNRPVLWPLGMIGFLILILLLPAWWTYRRRMEATAL